MPSYNKREALLYQISLGSNIMTEFSFDIERALFLRSAPTTAQGPHVFVSGLARSGTTVLMRTLYATHEYASLTYRDMPFVLAPNLWHHVSSAFSRSMSTEERAHEDGILIDFDSPEALEEIFWRTHLGHNYIRDDRLVPHEIDAATAQKFTDFMALVLRRYGKSRYLSKGNNNLLRLPSLIKTIPNAVFLVPFRDPFQQAYSLMRQDQLFTRKHQSDSFSSQYMSWLVHHEFGADFRPFDFGNLETKSSQRTNTDFWLSLWVAAYRYLVDSEAATNSRVHFVNYDNLCDTSDASWAAISALVRLPIKKPMGFEHRHQHSTTTTDLSLASTARELHSTLSRLSVSQGEQLLKNGK